MTFARGFLISLATIFMVIACVPNTQVWRGELSLTGDEPLTLKHPEEGWVRELESGRYNIEWHPNVRQRTAEITISLADSYESLGSIQFSWRGRSATSSIFLSADEIGQDFDVRAKIERMNPDERRDIRQQSCHKMGYCYSCVNYIGEQVCDFQFSTQCPGTQTVEIYRERWQNILEIQFLKPGSDAELGRFTSDPMWDLSDESRVVEGPCL